jgi:transposase
MKKKYRDQFNNKLKNELKNLVIKHNSKLPVFNVKNSEKYNTNSFFDINIKNANNKNLNKFKFINNTKDYNFKSQRLILEPTEQQKDMLLNMLDGCRKVYNYTNQFIKKMFFEKKQIPSWKTIRTSYLKQSIKEIAIQCRAPIHTLDYAVKECESKYRACFNNQNIKHFNIRYKKKNKNNLCMTLEKETLRAHNFIPSVFKDEIKNKGDKKYTNEHNVIIVYNRKQNQFNLYKPISIENENLNKNRKKYISLDPGVRTFLTGMNDEQIIDIAPSLNDEFKTKLQKINYYGNKRKYSEKNKKLREKLQNKIKDMHWKTINYLTTHYDNILIGKLSTSSIVNNDTSILSSMQKQLIHLLSHYTFRERLKYKCGTKKVNCIEINESFTTKMCSKCGCINEIGPSKIYECKVCKICIDRDYNGCRNIFYKGLK